MDSPKYRRIVLKLSGEALAGSLGYGIDPDVINRIAGQIKEVVELKVQMAIVIGAGNIWRGIAGNARGMDRVTADYMGMLATVMNSLALQDALIKMGVETRTQSAFEMRAVTEHYVRQRAISHLNKGRVVILAAGTGSPYHSTDTAAALRAAEIDAQVILMAKQVDGVYDSDPVKNPEAKKFDELTYLEVLKRGLRVMDSTAASLCMDNEIPLIVFNLNREGNIKRAVFGEKIGTYVGGE